jgi:hypothetical protein
MPYRLPQRGVAVCGVGDRLSLFEQFLAEEEGYSEPIDELGKVIHSEAPHGPWFVTCGAGTVVA